MVSPTDAAGDSRETVITFAGARSVFGETDGTIARQKHPFSAISWRAKASRISRKRTEVLALVLTVSSRRASSSFGAKKFALRTKNGPKTALYGLLGELFRGNACGRACWASFFAETPETTAFLAHPGLPALTCTATRSACGSARGRGPGRSRRKMSSDD